MELLYRWRREYQKYENNSFPGKGKPKMTDLEKENARLRKELRDAKMERDSLKKAVSIFSKHNYPVAPNMPAMSSPRS